MPYAQPTDNGELSDILAQLLEPPGSIWAGAGQDSALTEESDLALTLRLLLEPDCES